MDRMKNKDLLKISPDLISFDFGVYCPCCKKVKHGPYQNLGNSFDQKEGCFDCWKNLETISKSIRHQLERV